MSVLLDNPAGAPAPAGPYSQIAKVEAGDITLLFLSGQVSVNDDGEFIGAGDMAAQARAVMENIGALLRCHGADFGDIVNIRSYLTDLDQRPAYGTVRGEYLSDPLPTSTTVEVSKLFLPDALLEVEAVAVLRR